MVTLRKVLFSSVVLSTVLLAGCGDLIKKLKGGLADEDGGVDAAAEAEAPIVTTPIEDVDAGALTATDTPATDTPATDTPAATATTATTPKVTDAGATAPAAADAGAAAAGQECCCEATGFALQSVLMSECNKTRKGQCVKKERCTAAAVVDAGAPATPTTAVTTATTPPPTSDNCCCAVAGRNRIMKQKDCSAQNGTCGKLAACLTMKGL